MVKESGHIEEAGQESLPPVEIKKLDDQRFEVEPAMMNPGDWFKIEIYTAANQLSLHCLRFLLLALPIAIRRRIKNTPANVQTSEAEPVEDSGAGDETKESRQNTS